MKARSAAVTAVALALAAALVMLALVIRTEEPRSFEDQAHATDGFSPSVTPAVHSTIATGLAYEPCNPDHYRLPPSVDDTTDWMVVVTADHGMQPDQADVDGFGINPREVEDEMESAGVTTGVFEGDDTVYEMAIPAAMLSGIDCDTDPGAASGWGMAYRMSPP